MLVKKKVTPLSPFTSRSFNSFKTSEDYEAGKEKRNALSQCYSKSLSLSECGLGQHSDHYIVEKRDKEPEG